MKILLENWRVRSQGWQSVLAKEIGLEQAEILLTLEAAIQTSGTRRKGSIMIARTTKQLGEMFPWCTPAHAKKLLESLQNRNYIFIDDETLLATDTTLWYSMGWQKIKTLKSITVMDDTDMEEAHEPVTKELKEVKPLGTNGFSHAFNALFGTFIQVCGFKQALLVPRDKGEIASSVKKLLALYAGKSVETEELQQALTGFPVWWIEIEGAKFGTGRNAPRPYTILSNWGKYEIYCKSIGRYPQSARR